MVKIRDSSWQEFVEDTKTRKVFCFGAGKQFKRFLDEFSMVDVMGVIDNFSKNSFVMGMQRGKKTQIPVFSIDEFIGKMRNSERYVIVITSQCYQEIIDQLDAVESLDGLRCYLFALLRRDGIRDEEIRYYIEEGRYEKADTLNLGNPNHFDGHHFQVCDIVSKLDSNAGSKAPYDIQKIAFDMGYMKIESHLLYGGRADDVAEKWSVRQNMEDWEHCYEIIPPKSILLVQAPCRQIQSARQSTLIRLKREKKVKIIALLHDIECLREKYNDYYIENDFSFMVKYADVFIVHTEKMKEFFSVKFGILPQRVVSLTLFDYLVRAERKNEIEFDRSIVIAGNLDPFKSAYIYKLSEMKDIQVNLFGSWYQPIVEVGWIKYHGVYSSERIVSVLSKGFGLVWDGESIDTCSGDTGEYLRYNSPHKLSLYLAAGLPVVIWKEAAEAEFVARHNLGILVSSLRELPGILEDMKEVRYKEYVDSVRDVSQKIRQGFFTKEALKSAEKSCHIT